MSSVRSLAVKARTSCGTSESRAERLSGFTPAILYGDKKDPVTLSIEERILRKELQEPGIFSHLYTIKVDNKDQQVLIRDIQFHPVSDRPLHVDLLRVSKSSAVHVDVPLVFLNEDKCPGLKMGGVLNILRHALHVVCSPTNIPEHIDIDLAGKDIGYSCTLSSLVLPAGVTISHLEKAETVLTIVPPKVQDESEETAAPVETEESSETEASE